jgi:hypothetical protein
MELCARAVGWRETDLASLLLDYAPDDVEPETGSLISPLEVKNGSKIVSDIVSGIPEPLSFTLMST